MQMKNDPNNSTSSSHQADVEDSAESLRRRAEEKVGKYRPKVGQLLTLEESAQLIHELQVHQVELEMQNEELRRVQLELEAARARYFDLYDLAPVGYLILSEEGTILEANLTAASLLGVTRAEMVRQPFSRFVGEEDQDVYYLHRKQLFAAGTPQTVELRTRKADGASIWVRLECTLREEAGVSTARVVMSDITEYRRLQTQLWEAQKMESIGRLAGGMAHDFNNMLAIILGYLEMAISGALPGTVLYEQLEEARKAAVRSADLTQQLLAFARKQIIKPIVLDLNLAVEGMLKMLRRLIGEDIDLVWQAGTDLWPVKMDPSQVHQVLANLCINARDAIAGAGTVTLATANVSLDESSCRGYAGPSPGDYVLLTVSDSGCGMDDKTLQKVFEPFFTTKGVGKGTGLGLATVHGIVKQNKGHISVFSETGRGTTFKIYFPRYAAMPAEIDAPRAMELPPSRGETVLLVEDEPAVLTMGKTMLERLGYAVLSAVTPDEAMRLAEQHGGEVHALLTDVIMPQMNGRELAMRVQAMHPNVKTLFMSGYAASIAQHGVLDKTVQFVQKPFSMRELAVKLREVLEGG